jgi:O-antigen ligase
MTINRLDNFIAAGLLGAIGFTALAHGAVEAWSVAIFELIILMLMLLWAIKGSMDKRFDVKIPLTALPLAAFFLLGLIQSISVTNENGQINSLSFDVEATKSTVKILFFLLVSHIIAANFFKSGEKLQKLTVILTIFGFALAIFGLLQYFTWNGNLYWLRPALVTTKGVVGPFVNHNHFAGYIELIVPLPIALIVTGAVNRSRILYGFAAVIMAIALAASLSRGGIISLAGGLLFILAAGIGYNRHRMRTDRFPEIDDNGFAANFDRSTLINFSAVVVIIGAIIIGVLWIGGNPIIERLTKNNVVSSDEKAESFESSRGWIWKNSITMFQMNPVSGVGMGAYETAYPQYSSENNGLSQNIDRAHNDYLQILSDTGLIGGAIALAFILSVLYSVGRSLRSPDPFRAGLAIGCGAAIFSMMVHSVFDFNLQIPSTALLFLVLTAISANLSDKVKEDK